MKKILVKLSALVSVLVLTLTGCQEMQEEVKVTGITLDQNQLELVVEATQQLNYTITPEEAANVEVFWTSSDEKIAKVSDKGLVTAVAPGKATIKVETLNGKKAECKVTVSAKVIAVGKVELNATSKTLEPAKTFQLEATVTPENATNKELTWKSSKEAVAKVSDKGLVTAVAEGEATITVTTKDGNKTATCKITVKKAVVAVTKVELNKANAELTEGEELQLEATVTPENATNKDLTWETSEAKIATVSDNGLVKAVKEGEATITVKAGDKTATCKITVKKAVVAVTGVTLNKETATLDVDGTVQLTATVNPTDATNKKISWASNKEEVAKVSDAGLVTAVAAGKATITVTTEDGNKTATCEITVNAPTVAVTGVTLDLSSKELKVKETVQLTATVNPTNATNKNVAWSSNNEEAATVSATGLVTAVAAGDATITVTTEDGNKTATCTIKVKAAGLTPKEYIESNGKTYGMGIKIDNVIFAPVNLINAGPADGKRFQWGRKDGYSAFLPGGGQATGATFETALPGKHYTDWSLTCAPAGTWGGNDGKTETNYDPCPTGWRVPTAEEMYVLTKACSYKNTGYLCGPNHETATEDDHKGCVFIKTSGLGFWNLSGHMGDNSARYWTTTIAQDNVKVKSVKFTKTSVVKEDQNPGFAYLIRCVQAE